MNHTTLNVDPAELAKFSDLAHRWWDPESEFRPLHEINPCGWTGSTPWHHCTANVCSTWAAAAASCLTRWPAEVRRCWA
jgi:hypothetical protein